MIAKWIAQALIRGDDHLILSVDELAKWQANGCRVSLNAPYSTNGPYIVRQVSQWNAELQSQLIAINPEEWPIGEVKLIAQNNTTTVVMPGLDFQALGDNKWRVPLIPSDPSHCLDSWAYDLDLSSDEFVALRPIAKELLGRCLLRCEIKSFSADYNDGQRWNNGRTALAEGVGVESIRMVAWFGLCTTRFGLPMLVHEIDSDDCIEHWTQMVRAQAELNYKNSVLKARRLIAKDEKYAYELQVRKADSDVFHLQFFSSLLTSWPNCEGQLKLALNLNKEQLHNLYYILQQSSGISEIPLPVNQDIAARVLANR